MTGASIREPVANLSREVAKTELPSFWKFSKQKHFPKTIKTLKNIFVFDQHIIEHVQHI